MNFIRQELSSQLYNLFDSLFRSCRIPLCWIIGIILIILLIAYFVNRKKS